MATEGSNAVVCSDNDNQINDNRIIFDHFNSIIDCLTKTILTSLIISQILYVLPAWEDFLSTELDGKIKALFRYLLSDLVILITILLLQNY